MSTPVNWPSISWSRWGRYGQGTRYPVGGHWAGRGVDPPPNDDDVLTVDELKERAHIEESDALMKSYISAARAQVESDIDCALITQGQAVGYDRLEPSGIYEIPMPPLQTIDSIIYMDVEGGSTTLDPDTSLAQIDLVSMPARIVFKPDAFAGLPGPLSVQCVGIAYTAGWTKATLPPLLKFAVGLLASHYLTQGRDLVNIERGNPMVIPMGYEAAIQAYRLERLV